MAEEIKAFLNSDSAEEDSYTIEEMQRINELEMWGPQGHPRGSWI